MKARIILVLLLIGVGFCGAVSAQETQYRETIQDSVKNNTKIYYFVELPVQPEYPGGMSEFYKEVAAEFKLPEVPKDIYRIFVSFVVEKDGSMSNIEIEKDPGYGLGDEAIRTLKLFKKKWAPGKLYTEPVRTRYKVPIVFNTKTE